MTLLVSAHRNMSTYASERGVNPDPCPVIDRWRRVGSQVSRRAGLGMLAAGAALLTRTSPSEAAYGESANIFGKATNTAGAPSSVAALQFECVKHRESAQSCCAPSPGSHGGHQRRLRSVRGRGLCAAAAVEVEPLEGEGLPRRGAQVNYHSHHCPCVCVIRVAGAQRGACWHSALFVIGAV